MVHHSAPDIAEQVGTSDDLHEPNFAIPLFSCIDVPERRNDARHINSA